LAKTAIQEFWRWIVELVCEQDVYRRTKGRLKHGYFANDLHVCCQGTIREERCEPNSVLGAKCELHECASEALWRSANSWLVLFCPAYLTESLIVFLDQIARQVEDPGLRHADKTQVGLELCTRHAAEFFGFYICRFVLTDIGMLLDKFIKRGSEWVLVWCVFNQFCYRAYLARFWTSARRGLALAVGHEMMRDGRRSQFSVDQRTCWDERDTKEEMAVFYLPSVICIASRVAV